MQDWSQSFTLYVFFVCLLYYWVWLWWLHGAMTCNCTVWHQILNIFNAFPKASRPASWIEIILTYFNGQPMINILIMRPACSLLRFYADSRKMCVSVKVVWMKLVPKQYFTLSILLLQLFIAAIHYLRDSLSHGVHWYAGKVAVKCRGMFQARRFHSL